MANRIDSLLSGIGNIAAVAAANDSDLGSDAASVIYRDWIAAVVNARTQTGLLDRRFLALICAAMNDSIVDTGWLWSCKEDGRLQRDYFADKDQRQLIASLITGN